jgi:hypothetical protein
MQNLAIILKLYNKQLSNSLTQIRQFEDQYYSAYQCAQMSNQEIDALNSQDIADKYKYLLSVYAELANKKAEMYNELMAYYNVAIEKLRKNILMNYVDINRIECLMTEELEDSSLDKPQYIINTDIISCVN